MYIDPVVPSQQYLIITHVLTSCREELDQVFSVSTRKHASYQLKNAMWHFRVWILRHRLEPLPPFYKHSEQLTES